MISTRSVELVIDTVVCLTLAKWETVSDQFGGYLSERLFAKLLSIAILLIGIKSNASFAETQGLLIVGPAIVLFPNRHKLEDFAVHKTASPKKRRRAKR
jgi:hypothetical protein